MGGEGHREWHDGVALSLASSSLLTDCARVHCVHHVHADTFNEVNVNPGFPAGFQPMAPGLEESQPRDGVPSHSPRASTTEPPRGHDLRPDDEAGVEANNHDRGRAFCSALRAPLHDVDAPEPERNVVDHGKSSRFLARFLWCRVFLFCALLPLTMCAPSGLLFGIGNNDFGQLGTADTITRMTPVLVRGLLSSISFDAVAAGGGHTLALTSTGADTHTPPMAMHTGPCPPTRAQKLTPVNNGLHALLVRASRGVGAEWSRYTRHGRCGGPLHTDPG